MNQIIKLEPFIRLFTENQDSKCQTEKLRMVVGVIRNKKCSNGKATR